MCIKLKSLFAFCIILAIGLIKAISKLESTKKLNNKFGISDEKNLLNNNTTNTTNSDNIHSRKPKKNKTQKINKKDDLKENDKPQKVGENERNIKNNTERVRENEKDIKNHKHSEKSNRNLAISKKALNSNQQANPFNPITPNQKPDFTSARNIKCIKDDNCRYPNYCISGNICQCGNENAEYLLNKNLEINETREKNIVFCAYQRKQQLVYFLLEMLLNMGAGHFYAGNTKLALFKFLLLLMPCFIMCAFGSVSSEEKSGISFLGTVLSGITSCALGIWWLVDVINIALANYTDGNGVPLKAW